MTKKLFRAAMIGIMAIGLSACMTVTIPLSVTNGPVGSPSQQVSAVTTDKEAFWFFALNNDGHYAVYLFVHCGNHKGQSHGNLHKVIGGNNPAGYGIQPERLIKIFVNNWSVKCWTPPQNLGFVIKTEKFIPT